MTFPKHIWQTWRHRHPPTLLKRCMRSFRILNPDWEFHFFTDDDIHDFIDTKFPALAEVIARYPGGVYLADIWRCLALYRHGGVYADVDVECVRPLEELIGAIHEHDFAPAGTEVILSRDHPVHERLWFGGRAMHMNFLMLAQPGAAFFKAYLDRLESVLADDPRALDRDPVALTGPGRFSDLIEAMDGPSAAGVSVIPWQWVSPIPDMGLVGTFPEREGYERLLRSGDWASELDPFTVHYWWHDYLKTPNTLRLFGESILQTDGVIASRRLERVVREDDDRGYLAARALAEFAELDTRTLVELSSTKTSTEFSRLVDHALGGLDHERLSDLPPDATGIGLLHVEPSRDETAETISAVFQDDRMAPNGLIAIPDIPADGDRLRRQILDQARTHRFEVLEERGGLLLRAPDPEAGVLIPKVVHQTWKTAEIPATFRREWIDSWMAHNEANGWQYRFWTDRDLLEFVEAEFPGFADCFLDYDHPIKRVDAVRYLILKRHGGLYADLDFACLKPLDSLLAGRRLLFGTEFDRPERHHDCVCNAFMASVPDHPFWAGIESDLREHAGREVLPATGPGFLGRRFREATRFFEEKQWPQIVRKELLYPFRWTEPRKDDLRDLPLEELAERYPDSYAITFWTGTWLQPEE